MTNPFAEAQESSQQVDQADSNEQDKGLFDEVMKAVESANNNGIRTTPEENKQFHEALDELDIEDIISKTMAFEGYLGKVTDADRKEAKDQLGDNELMGLLPKGDQQTLKSLHSALIDGDLDSLKDTLKGLADNPERLKKFVDIVNKTFEKNEGYGGIDLGMDGKGNVLVYEEGGNTAVSINPADGSTTLRAVETQRDGSVLLKPGEIINRTTGEVMSSISDEATRSIISRNSKLEIETPIRGWGGGGGGGGTAPGWIDDNPRNYFESYKHQFNPPSQGMSIIPEELKNWK